MLKNFGLFPLLMFGLVVAGCGGGAKNTAEKEDPLQAAIHSDNAAEAVRLVTSRGMKVDGEYEGHGTLLGHAAFHGACDVVDALLKLDADADAGVVEIGGEGQRRTPLHSAMDPSAGHDNHDGFLSGDSADRVAARCIEILLRHGADPAYVDESGNSYLHWAGFRGHSRVIGMLLEHGADPNARDIVDGNTALHMVKSSERQMIAALLEAGADRNLRNHKGRTTFQAREELQRAADEEAAEAERAERQAQMEAAARARELDRIRRQNAQEKQRILREGLGNIQRQLCSMSGAAGC